MNRPLPGNDYQLHVLPNGLRLAVAELPEALSVSCAVYFSVGARYEDDAVAGVSHMVEHMAFKGTAKWPSSEEVSSAIERVGGTINASTTYEATAFYAKVPFPHLELVLDVLSDLVRHPLLPEDVFEKEKDVIREELNAKRDIPEVLVHRLNQELIWGDHPLGREVVGTEESLAALQLQDVREHLRRFYSPNRCVVSVAGQVRNEDVVRAVEEHLDSWEPTGPASFLPAPAWPVGPRLKVERRETEQAQVCLALPGLPRDDEDQYTLFLMDAILGEGMGSRLFRRIREELSLAYSVFSFTHSYQDSGVLGLTAGVNPAKAGEAVAALLDEWVRLREDVVSDEELERARQLIKGRLLLSLENSFAVAAWFGEQELLRQEVQVLDDVLAALDQVRPEHIQQVARRLVRPSQLVMTVVGPFEDETPFVRSLEACAAEQEATASD